MLVFLNIKRLCSFIQQKCFRIKKLLTVLYVGNPTEMNILTLQFVMRLKLSYSSKPFTQPTEAVHQQFKRSNKTFATKV